MLERELEPSIDWAWLRDRMIACPWSSEARDAGIWAIDALQEALGPRWPQAWQRPGCAPPELAACWYSLAGYAATLDMALAFSTLDAVSGIRALRDAVRGTARADALASPRLQLRVASLALLSGQEVRLEAMLPGGETPADLLISGRSFSCGIEALAVLRDKRTLEASRWLENVTAELHFIGQRHRVDFRGTVDNPLDEHGTAELLEELEQRAAVVARGLKLPEVRVGGVTVTVFPAGGPGGQANFRMPMISHERRLAQKVRAKVAQTRRSGADWLLIDALDLSWHLGARAHRHLAHKARVLADQLRALMGAEHHLLGAVITDGAALMRPRAQEETIELDAGAIALCRRVDNWRVRESVVVSLDETSRGGAQLLRRVLDAESGWLARAVEHVGLSAPPELVI